MRQTFMVSLRKGCQPFHVRSAHAEQRSPCKLERHVVSHVTYTLRRALCWMRKTQQLRYNPCPKNTSLSELFIFHKTTHQTCSKAHTNNRTTLAHDVRKDRASL
jgi:hypothetical protein